MSTSGAGTAANVSAIPFPSAIRTASSTSRRTTAARSYGLMLYSIIPASAFDRSRNWLLNMAILSMFSRMNPRSRFCWSLRGPSCSFVSR